MTDRQIYDLMSEDYAQGFEVLFIKYYKSLAIYSCGMTDDLESAEDLVQNVFCKCLAGRSLLRTDPAKLKSYLFTAVRNTTLNHLGAQRRQHNIENLADLQADDDQPLYDDLIIEQIKARIAALPPQTRQVVEQVLLNNLSYKEVASQYSISVNTVKTLLARGLKRLRTELGERDYLLGILIFFKL